MKLSDLIDRLTIVTICVRQEPKDSNVLERYNILRGLLFDLYERDGSSDVPKPVIIELRKMYGLISGNYYALTGRRLEPLP